ncbi:MAG: hypothetical protein U0W40_04620 [Acidimicrobiia bacterium]
MSDANTRRRAWYRRHLPVVVADPDAPVVPDLRRVGRRRARRARADARDQQVDARRKTEDVLEWGRGFGGVGAVIWRTSRRPCRPGRC